MAKIIANSQTKEFHLQNKQISYILCVLENGQLGHLYYGKRISHRDSFQHFLQMRSLSHTAYVYENDYLFTLDTIRQEYPSYGTTDFREPAFQIQQPNGSCVTNFQYRSYRIYDGKKKLQGLPAVYTESGDAVQTLELCLKEERRQLVVYLSYSVFEDYDVITRCMRCENRGKETVELLSVQSATVDFYAPNYKLMHLSGDWMREANVEFSSLDHMHICIDSKRGSSSAMAQPFAALVEPNADEDGGKVFGFSFVYSGSFQIEAERDSVGQTRMNVGISPFDFNWKLAPDEMFQTPEAVLVYSGQGIGLMSERYHRIYRERLCRGLYRDQIRPMVINHFDATGTDFTEEKLVQIAEAGAQIGLELFVLDDGWFGDAAPGIRPLGDWFVDTRKLPGGLKSLVDRINEKGMKFGIWFEPEVLSPETHLYREHPEWCMKAPGKESTQMYHQLLLDLAKTEVQEYLVKAISDILDSANIAYVKWDYNRNIVETENQMQRHKYILGLYHVLETLTEKYPEVLFEGCSSGGGRFDPGMLYYMPQTWTSDNQKAMARLKIQHGMSMVYPPITMTAHAGQVETGKEQFNHDLNTSAMVAMGGNFGFEMDLSRLSAVEMEQVREYVKCYREIRKTIQFGTFYRLSSPFADENVAWEFVGDGQAVLFTYRRSGQKNDEEWRVMLRGLKKEGIYELQKEAWRTDGATEGGKCYRGEVLMNLGFRVPHGNFSNESHCFIFTLAGRRED